MPYFLYSYVFNSVFCGTFMKDSTIRMKGMDSVSLGEYTYRTSVSGFEVWLDLY